MIFFEIFLAGNWFKFQANFQNGDLDKLFIHIPHPRTPQQPYASNIMSCSKTVEIFIGLVTTFFRFFKVFIFHFSKTKEQLAVIYICTITINDLLPTLWQ